MSTTHYVITDDTFKPDSIEVDHRLAQAVPLATNKPKVYDDLEDAREYVEWVRAEADFRKGNEVIDATSSNDFTVIFGADGSIRVVRVVPFVTEILTEA